MKKILSILLSLSILMGCTAACADVVKHERVYVVADADGDVITLIDSVRLENADASDVLNDRTGLSDIENVGGHASFERDGEALVWQAGGADIRYQGHGSSSPAVTPVAVMAEDSLTVSFRLERAMPCVAVTVVPLPDTMRNVHITNGFLADEGIARAAVGFAILGMDEGLGLPDRFTVSWDVGGDSPSWMMTIATAEPMKLLEGLADEHLDTARLEDLLADAESLLTALLNAEEITLTEGDLAEAATTLNALLSGTASLSEGATQVSDGAAALQEGASQLQAGLDALCENNETLNAGAEQLFAAVLSAAYEQLSAADMGSLGIEIPELTADDYSDVLTGLIATLQTAADGAEEQARAQVSAAVDAQEDAICAAVTEAVREQVLTAVLGAAGMQMDAAAYAAAVQAGLISEAQNGQISALVDGQMASEDVQAQIQAVVAQQKETLIEQNMASEEVQAALGENVAAAQAAIDGLQALLAQLDSVQAFVTGLNAYTYGVSQAAAGAASLTDGAGSLAAGSLALSEGAADLDSGLRKGLTDAAEKLLPYVQNDAAEWLAVLETTMASMEYSTAYDLVAEGMENETVYIIRTVLED